MHNARPSIFQLVAQMNEAFGNPRGNPHAIDWARVQQQARNIAGDHNKDEYGELSDAIAVQSVDDARDAFCDIIVFALGGLHLMGYDGDEDVTEVLRAVTTRFCRNEDHLAQTLAHYAQLGIRHVYTGGEFPRKWVKTSGEQQDHKGERYSSNKFLKALGYEQPKLRPAEPL